VAVVASYSSERPSVFIVHRRFLLSNNIPETMNRNDSALPATTTTAAAAAAASSGAASAAATTATGTSTSTTGAAVAAEATLPYASGSESLAADFSSSLRSPGSPSRKCKPSLGTVGEGVLSSFNNSSGSLVISSDPCPGSPNAASLPPRSPGMRKSTGSIASASRSSSLKSPRRSVAGSLQGSMSNLINKPLLEEVSVHMSLPSNHPTNSLLELNDSTSSLGDESFGGDLSSDDIFQNSFSIIEADQGQLTGKSDAIDSMMKSMPANMSMFQNSFSDQTIVSTRSTFTTQTAGVRGSGRRRASRRRRGGAGADFDDDSSQVSRRSFRDWSGNEKIKPWSCPTCTYTNESPLLLACEICGTLQPQTQQPQTQTQAEPVATISEEDASSSVGGGGSDARTVSSEVRRQVDSDLTYLQQEQMRELVSIQREIASSFRPPQEHRSDTLTQPPPSAYDTHQMSQEISNIEEDSGSSGPAAVAFTSSCETLPVANSSATNAAARSADDTTPQWMYEDEQETSDSEDLVNTLLEQQRQILSDFQRNRTASPLSSDRKKK